MFVHKFSVSIHKFQESHVWWEDGDAGVKGMLELVLLRCKPLGCSPLIFPHLLGVPLFFHVCLPPFNYYTDPVSNLVSNWVFFCKVCSTAFFVAQCTGELLLVALWQWISQSTVLSRETCPSQVLMKAQFYIQFYSTATLSGLHYKGFLVSDTLAAWMKRMKKSHWSGIFCQNIRQKKEIYSV